MIRMASICIFTILGLATLVAASPKKQPSRADREQAFSRKMSGAALIGAFTIDGKNDKNPPRPERYELGKVVKARGDFWTFYARIKYGKKDQTAEIPITVKVLWAGDTPMISLDDLTIPGMGTFTARVLFHGNRYVGTWQHGKVGGHMFGRVESKAGVRKTGRINNGNVTGRVVFDGKPLAGAIVEFAHVDGQGKPVKSTTDAEGAFRLTTPAGRHVVRVRLIPGTDGVKDTRPAIPSRFNRKSVLIFQVQGGKNNCVLRLNSR